MATLILILVTRVCARLAAVNNWQDLAIRWSDRSLDGRHRGRGGGGGGRMGTRGSGWRHACWLEVIRDLVCEDGWH